MSVTLEVSRLSGLSNGEDSNIAMLVTLDVLKLSGWLNADAWDSM